MTSTALAGVVMIALIFITLAFGFPIGLSIGLGSAAAMFIIMPNVGFVMVSAQKMFQSVNSFSLLAIPFFVLAGNLMNSGGIARRLVGCAKLVAHRLPGSLAQTNIVANMLFGAMSGSGVAAAVAMGGILGPMEKEEGYSDEYIAVCNIASGPTGMMIPPSNIMIVYSTVAGSVSIAALFMAGYMPGVIWGLGCMIIAGIMAKRRGYISKEHYSFQFVMKTLWEGIPSLLMIVIVIGGILGGIFTATEGSAIAVMYSLILGFIYKNISVKSLPRVLFESVKTTAVIEYLVCVSGIMGYVMSYTHIPALVANGILGFTSNKYVILFIMNIILLIVGCFMDPTPAVLIFTPIFLPIVQTWGMSPVHFGLMMVMNLCVGTLTPPVGAILFAGCRVNGVKIEQIIKMLLPFFAIILLSLLLVTYVPWVTMFIPQALGLC
ncbi:MAG: TRAP transporter large permease [Lawsonibacter sp.]